MDKQSNKPGSSPPETPPRAKPPRDAGIHLVADEGWGTAPGGSAVLGETQAPPVVNETVASVQKAAQAAAALQETGAFAEVAAPAPDMEGSGTSARPAPTSTAAPDKPAQVTQQPRAAALQETGAFSDDKPQETAAPRKQATMASPTPATTQGASKAPPAGGKLTALGDFKLISKLGAGGMGVVYKARQVSLERDVALKVLAKQLADNADFVARFQREAKLMARLEHPHVLRCYHAGLEHGFHFLAIEFVDGGSMESWLKKLGRLSVGDALHVILKCAEALQYAHEQGLVHRDIKPDNLLLTKRGVVKLADLGLAKATAEDVGLTRTGTGAGTPLYMSPEQARDAKHVDGRTDIYALGCMLYAFLTGHPPFGGQTYVEVIENKMKGKYPRARLSNDQIPPRLDLIIDKMLVVNPDQRYQSCAEVIKDLEGLGLANKTLSFVDGKEGVPAPAASRSAAARAPGGPARADAKAAPGAKPTTPAAPPEEGPDIWYVNFRNAKGKAVTKKMTTSQIIDLIKDDRLDESDRVSRSLKENFRALGTIREFESVLQHKILKARADRRAAKFEGAFEKLAEEHERYQRWKWIRNKLYSVGGFFTLLLWLAVIGGVVYGAYYVIAHYALAYVVQLFHLK